MKTFLRFCLIAAIVFTPTFASAWLGDYTGTGGGSGGGGGDHDSLTGVTPSQHHTATVDTNAPEAVDFACTVGPSGDYADFDTAWAANCYRIFVQNKGTAYTLTTDLVLDDPTEGFYLIGESVEGVTINNGAFSFRIVDSARPLPTPAGSVTGSVGSTALTGDTTQFSTWGLTTGDMICPHTLLADICYEIETVTDETNLVLTEVILKPFTGVVNQVNTFLGQPYKDVKVGSFTLSGGTDSLIHQTSTVNSSYKSMLVGAEFRNIKSEVSQTFISGYGREWVVDNIAGDVNLGQMAPLSVLTNIYTAGAQSLGGSTKYAGSTIANPNHQIGQPSVLVGGIIHGTSSGDYTGDTGAVVVGNIRLDGDPLVEQLYDSLNLPGSLYLGGEDIFSYDLVEGHQVLDTLQFLSTADMSTATSELLLPKQATDCSGYIKEAEICYDIDDKVLYLGDGTTANELKGGASIEATSCASAPYYVEGALCWEADADTLWIGDGVGQVEILNVIVSATPTITFDDSDSTFETADATIAVNASAIGDGIEYVDVTMSQLINGTLTSFLTADADGAVTIGTDAQSTKIEGSLDMSAATAPGSHTVGHMSWNTDDGTLDIMTDKVAVIQVGQEVLIRVKNVTGVEIPNGTAVRFNGISGDKPTIIAGSNDAEITSYVAGLTTSDIPTDTGGSTGEGFVTCLGQVRGLDTETIDTGGDWLVGDLLYLDTAGGLTKEEPEAPLHAVMVGIITRVHATDGYIFVKAPSAHGELFEHHDVLSTIDDDSSTGSLLIWDDGADQRWESTGSAVLADATGALSATGVVNFSGASQHTVRAHATDCSTEILEGEICYEQDDDVLYLGNGTAAEEVVTSLPSTAPFINLDDSDTTPTTDAYIKSDATITTPAAEDVKMEFQHLYDGALTTFLTADAENDMVTIGATGQSVTANDAFYIGTVQVPIPQYCSINFDDGTTPQTLDISGGAGTFDNVLWDNAEASSGCTADITTDERLELSATGAGDYQISFSVSFAIQTAAGEIECAVFTGTTAQTQEESITIYRDAGTAGAIGVAAGSSIVTLAASDSITVKCTNNSAANDIDIYQASVSAHRVGM